MTSTILIPLTGYFGFVCCLFCSKLWVIECSCIGLSVGGYTVQKQYYLIFRSSFLLLTPIIHSYIYNFKQIIRRNVVVANSQNPCSVAETVRVSPLLPSLVDLCSVETGQQMQV